MSHHACALLLHRLSYKDPKTATKAGQKLDFSFAHGWTDAQQQEPAAIWPSNGTPSVLVCCVSSGKMTTLIKFIWHKSLNICLRKLDDSETIEVVAGAGQGTGCLMWCLEWWRKFSSASQNNPCWFNLISKLSTPAPLLQESTVLFSTESVSVALLLFQTPSLVSAVQLFKPSSSTC